MPPERIPFGQTVCQRCRRQLWYLCIRTAPTYFRFADVELVQKLFHATKDMQGKLMEAGFDGFDAVDLIVEFEDELAAAR
jgi:hypothetical protein